ncbi:tetratricopeptide repeat protein [Flavobacteriaceae bacterium M23B6Z8]
METIVDSYLIKALEAYPYEMEEAMEALNYALSYNAKNPIALSLMGRIYADSFQDYEAAKSYFEQALAADIHSLGVYEHYLKVLIWNEDYEEARTLIEFALTVKGSDKGMLYLKQAIVNECEQNYKAALASLKQAKTHAYNNCFITDLDEAKIRIKSKLPKRKKTKKMKKKNAR